MRRSRSASRLPALPALSLLALAWVTSPRLAAASPVLDTVGTVGGSAGAQGVVSGPGAGSTYFNPALLVDAEETALVGFVVAEARVRHPMLPLRSKAYRRCWRGTSWTCAK